MAKERFIVFSSLAAFNAGSDKYDKDSIVFVKDPAEPGIYTHNYGWVTLPSNGAANQILSFIEGKAKWMDKDYYTKAEVEEKLEEIDVTDQLVDYAKSEDVTKEINEAVEAVEKKIPSLEGYAKEEWVEAKGYITEASLEPYAKTAEVESKISAVKSEILGGAGQDYDTLKEIETWINAHQDLYQALLQTLATKATTEYVDEQIEALEDVYAKKEELAGTLEDYAKKVEVTAEIAEALEDYVTEEEVDQKLEGYYSKEEVDAMWAWGEY